MGIIILIVGLFFSSLGILYTSVIGIYLSLGIMLSACGLLIITFGKKKSYKITDDLIQKATAIYDFKEILPSSDNREIVTVLGNDAILPGKYTMQLDGDYLHLLPLKETFIVHYAFNKQPLQLIEVPLHKIIYYIQFGEKFYVAYIHGINNVSRRKDYANFISDDDIYEEDEQDENMTRLYYDDENKVEGGYIDFSFEDVDAFKRLFPKFDYEIMHNNINLG